jgi:hypothetical protein
MPSATSTRGLARARRIAAADLLAEKAVLISIMSRTDGRRWMWLLLEQCGAFLDVEGETLDSLGRMGHRMGKRSLGLLLMRQVTTHTPEMYIRMTAENTNYKPPEDIDNGQPDDGTDDD